jgi:hypothetical protein
MPEIVPTLGRLLEGTVGRDAIHIAIAPVVAGEELWPGQHIGFANAGEHHTVIGAAGMVRALGIVDPYLRQRVFLGDRFYMFLYPQTITGLRHEWTHPAFPQEPTPAERAEADARMIAALPDIRVEGAPRSTPLRSHAEQWLHEFANEWGFDFRTMIADASAGRPLITHETDIHSWAETGKEQEFWSMLQIYTGQVFTSEHREETYFSCSC